MPHTVNSSGRRGLKTFSVLFVSALMLSGCLQFTSSGLTAEEKAKRDDLIMKSGTIKQVPRAKEEADEDATPAKKKMAKDKPHGKAAKQDKAAKGVKAHAAVKKEIKKIEKEAWAKDKAAPMMARSGVVSGEQLNNVNERLEELSGRIEEVSDKLQKLAMGFDEIPEKLAEVDLAILEMDADIKTMSGSKAPPRVMSKPISKPMTEPASKSAPKAVAKPVASPKQPVQLLKKPGSAFWGIQLGAYKTRQGAEAAWGDLLLKASAIELNDAKVQFVSTGRLKNGKILTMIIINKYPNKGAAKKACKILKNQGVDCVARYAKP